jgi:hypothetical protein
LIDNGASLNLIMRKTIIEMGFNLKDMTLYMIRLASNGLGNSDLQ